MAIEEPAFKLDMKAENFEVRSYDATLVAETEVASGFEDAGNRAFRILAAYIFGNNKTKSKIEMTAPVTQQAPSEKIKMTAPVGQLKTAGGYLVQFTMPSQYTLRTIPEPNDGRVHIRQIPAHKVAVYQYSGSWSESKYNEKLKLFRLELEKNKIPTFGEPVFALVLPLKLPMKIAVGTSLAIISANSFFGFTISVGNPNFDWPLLLKIAAIGIFGIVLGQFYSSKVNEKLLKRGFGYFVLVIGSFVIIDQIMKMI